MAPDEKKPVEQSEEDQEKGIALRKGEIDPEILARMSVKVHPVKKALLSFWNWYKFPVFYEPLEDRLKSRWLMVATFSVLIGLVAAVLINPKFTSVEVIESLDTLNLRVIFVSSDPLEIGSLAALPIKLRLTNAVFWPAPSVDVTVKVTSRKLSSEMATIFPACVEGNFEAGHLALTRFGAVCETKLEGSVAATDEDGVATFSKLAIVNGLPGAYKLTFSETKTGTSTSEWVTVISPVVNLAVSSAIKADTTTPIFLRPGLTIASPIAVTVRVTHSGKSQLGNRRVVAVAINDLGEIGFGGPQGKQYVENALGSKGEQSIKSKNVLLTVSLHQQKKTNHIFEDESNIKRVTKIQNENLAGRSWPTWNHIPFAFAGSTNLCREMSW